MTAELTGRFLSAFGAIPPDELHDDGYGLANAGAFRVALMIPMCGSAGLWGPSCIASAQVAVKELNMGNGIAGREVQLVLIDAAIEAQISTDTLVNALIESGSIDAIVGMHISAVRQRLVKIVRGRVPYVYTPLYEGGEHTPGVYTIGDTPPKQLGPAMQYLQRKYHLTSWALIGNDYVWPRASNSYAKYKLAEMGAGLAYEHYLPFGGGDLASQVARVAGCGADAVLISLVGQDAVDFNRMFGALGLDRQMIRLSCAIEENALLASGAPNLKRLFSAASYFSVVDTAENAMFREKYHGLHGDRAPVLNTLGQSTYEGMQFLSALMHEGGKDWRKLQISRSRPLSYRSARQARYGSNSFNGAPVYLARADGVLFNIVKNLH